MQTYLIFPFTFFPYAARVARRSRLLLKNEPIFRVHLLWPGQIPVYSYSRTTVRAFMRCISGSQIHLSDPHPIPVMPVAAR